MHLVQHNLLSITAYQCHNVYKYLEKISISKLLQKTSIVAILTLPLPVKKERRRKERSRGEKGEERKRKERRKMKGKTWKKGQWKITKENGRKERGRKKGNGKEGKREKGVRGERGENSTERRMEKEKEEIGK